MSERYGRMRYAHFEARGWPLLSNYAIVEPVNDWQQYVPASLWNGVQAFPRDEVSHIATLPMPSDCILPLRPLWPGFAVNTLFYAFILWLLFGAPFALRQWRRIKRGLCPKC